MKSPRPKAAKSKRRLLEPDDLDQIDEDDLRALFTDDLTDDLCGIVGVGADRRDDLKAQVIGVAWRYRVGLLPTMKPPSGTQMKDDLSTLKGQAKKLRTAIDELNPETDSAVIGAALELDGEKFNSLNWFSTLKEEQLPPSLKGRILLGEVSHALERFEEWVTLASDERGQRRVHPDKENTAHAVIELARVWVGFKNKLPSRYDPESKLRGEMTTPFAKFVLKALAPAGVTKISDAMVKAAIIAVGSQ